MQNELTGRQALEADYKELTGKERVVETIKKKAGFGNKLDDFAKRQQQENQRFNKYGVNDFGTG